MGQGLISKMLCSASGSKNIWTGIFLEYVTEICVVVCSVSRNGVCRQINENKILCMYKLFTSVCNDQTLKWDVFFCIQFWRKCGDIWNLCNQIINIIIVKNLYNHYLAIIVQYANTAISWWWNPAWCSLPTALRGVAMFLVGYCCYVCLYVHMFCYYWWWAHQE